MKKLLLKFKIIVLLLLVLQSCDKGDSYYDLTTEAKDLLLYEVGDTFKLKNVITDEVVNFTVSSKEFYHFKESNAGWWLASSGGDDYFESGSYSFTGDSNCYNGTVSVQAKSNGGFRLIAYSAECLLNNSSEYQNEPLTTININGIDYSNVYIIRSNYQTLFYSKEKGVLKITNDFTNETQFIIEE